MFHGGEGGIEPRVQEAAVGAAVEPNDFARARAVDEGGALSNVAARPIVAVTRPPPAPGVEIAEAREAFRAVDAEARRVGVLWRAALALIELDATPVTAPDRGDRFLQSAATLVRENFPRSFIARRLGWWTRAFDDRIAAKLSPRQREVLRHFLSAKSTKQMAQIMGLSEHTVKEYQAAVFRLFGVNSKDELLVACYQRGIGSPSWWDALDGADAPIAEERSPHVAEPA